MGLNLGAIAKVFVDRILLTNTHRGTQNNRKHLQASDDPTFERHWTSRIWTSVWIIWSIWQILYNYFIYMLQFLFFTIFNLFFYLENQTKVLWISPPPTVIIYYCPVSFPFPASAVYLLWIWSASVRSTRRTGAFVLTGEPLVPARGSQEQVSGAPLTHNGSTLPTSRRPPVQNKVPRQDRSGRGKIICRSVTLPVTSGETENSRHYLLCCRHPLWCLRSRVWTCVFSQAPRSSASHQREMDANHRSDIMI